MEHKTGECFILDMLPTVLIFSVQYVILGKGAYLFYKHLLLKFTNNKTIIVMYMYNQIIKHLLFALLEQISNLKVKM